MAQGRPGVLIPGSPVHMGSMDWRVKKFSDTVGCQFWMKNTAVGKVVAALKGQRIFG
ncbi:MAG: hypothetical protein JRJ72_10175 [Deltaproteobacteria bacterium]|nr:hypothetical protein [Deltaproteobacteria bacterium]MBW2356488.1 hypothetical protein [Deltaproteobacteria bacterium]